ncbi:hypothetical protein HK405_003502 [Cladochytrium tenue]|nr:hypothetical protein HK405_003502 [Cladochytrium tenue]
MAAADASPAHIQEALTRALALGKELFALSAPGEWHAAGTSNVGHAKLFLRYTPEAAHMPQMRGDVADAPFEPGEVLAALSDPEGRKAWDPRFERAEVVGSWDDGATLLVHSLQKGVLLISGRDFCSANRVFREEGVIYLVQVSVEDPRVPPVHGRVRGTLKVAVWIVRPAASGTPGHSDVTYIAHVDPNGSIPSAVLRVGATETPSCAGFLVADMIKKKKHTAR